MDDHITVRGKQDLWAEGLSRRNPSRADLAEQEWVQRFRSDGGLLSRWEPAHVERSTAA